MGIDIASDRKEKAEKAKKDAIKEQASKEKMERLNAKYNKQAKPKFICTQCGTGGKQKLITKGNLGLEIILWLFFLLPGIIYSIWRHASRTKGCPKCNGPMVSTDSPIGADLLQKYHKKMA